MSLTVRLVSPLCMALSLAPLGCSTDDDDGGATAADTHAEHDDHSDHGESGTGSTGADDGGSTTSVGDPESTGAGESTGADGSTGAGESSTGAAAIDTWENWALPEYFQPYCIECHPGASQRDFNMYDVVVENVDHVRCGSAPMMLPDCDDHIEPGHLPIGDGPFPTDDERLRLVAWIDAGMPRDP